MITVHDNCPHCGANQIGEQIPDEFLSRIDLTTLAEISYNGPPQFYRHSVLMEIPGVYDGGLFMVCPFCDGAWHRWPEGHYLHKRAEPFIQRHNEMRKTT